MLLVTIPFSHYNEKARWALQRFGVAYRERRYMPMFHFFGVLWATRGRPGRSDTTSTRWSTPLLLAGDGTRLHDSSAIARYASERFGDERTTLYPAQHRDRIEQLEGELSREVGAHTRRIAYHYLLADPRWYAQLAHNNVGRAQAVVYNALGPLVRGALRRALGVTDRGAEASLAEVREQMDRLGDVLGDRPYLVGDRFTAADLTAACLLAPMLMVRPEEGYGAVLEPDYPLPSALVALRDDVRATRIGRYVLRMFAEERGPARGTGEMAPEQA